MTRWAALLVLLLTVPASAEHIYLAKKGAPPAGCTEFTESTWDNLTGWTQDSANAFTADSINDELDMASGTNWIYNNTTTTTSDQCACWTWNSIAGGNDRLFIALRFPTSDSQNFYVFGWYDNTWYWSSYQRTASGATWVGDNATWGGTPAFAAGDSWCACASGTGNVATVGQLWHFSASAPPGNCRSDWGTPTFSQTGGCSAGACVDTNSNVGFVSDAASAMSIDNFIGNDPD